MNNDENSFVWIIAPKRGTSFDNFCEKAKLKFIIKFKKFEPNVSETLEKLKNNLNYKEDHHNFFFIELKKKFIL